MSMHTQSDSPRRYKQADYDLRKRLKGKYEESPPPPPPPVREDKRFISSGKSIEVTNLAKEIQIEELLVLFAQFGEINKLNIGWDVKKAKRCYAR